MSIPGLDLSACRLGGCGRQEPLQKPDSPRKKVLCIEDNALNRAIYKAILQRFNDRVDVTFAASQHEALDIVATPVFDYHYIITDFELGDGNADVVIVNIRERSLVPILLCTSLPRKSPELSPLYNLGIGYHSKPIPPRDICTFLELKKA